MNSNIYRKIKLAQADYDEVMDRYERGDATVTEVHDARRRLGDLRWERDNLYPQPAPEFATEYEAILSAVYA